MNLINKTELIKVVERMPRHSEYNKDDILEIINSVEDCKFCELNDKDKFEFDMKKFEKFFKKVFTFEE